MAQTHLSQQMDDTAELCGQINTALDTYTQFGRDCPSRLGEAIRYGLLGPGKRLRPRLVVMAAEACGGTLQASMPAACAVEMVHAYSLIHDDLPAMDDDELRRGRSTCHSVFGDALAILAGDALLALAFEILAKDVRPPETAAFCCAELAQSAGATALVGGQADDLANDVPNGAVERLEDIHRRKTGAIFLASLRLGGLTAGASSEPLKALHTYGIKLGLAFQITDDLLDVSGNERVVGKRLGKDSQRGRVTFPAILGIDASRQQAERLVSEACEALAPLGTAADRLAKLARSIPDRER